ncbi:MAG: alpha/beta fold hydrolase, partial [Candidatus Binatia bacterium]
MDVSRPESCKRIKSVTPVSCALAILCWFVCGSDFVIAQAQPATRPFKVRAPDGVLISAQEWGNPDGPGILLIHGFSQSHLSWSRQFGGEPAKSFRIITYDIRGHGGSDKP